VAMDMSKSYANAVLEVFGGSVDIVHDTFHVVALASKAIDETRRERPGQASAQQFRANRLWEVGNGREGA